MVHARSTHPDVRKPMGATYTYTDAQGTHTGTLPAHTELTVPLPGGYATLTITALRALLLDEAHATTGRLNGNKGETKV